jgi:DNA-binding SARP family transcriptional activator
MLAHIALLYAAPEQRSELLPQALMLAASIEAVEPQAAVTALLADRTPAKVLDAFVARFERGAGDAGDLVRIDVLSRTVYRNGTAVDLPERELALLIAFARQRRGYSRAEIVDLLWEDLDETAAREAFNSCLYRLRNKLPGVVLWTRESGYRLHELVRVDIREIEQWVGSLSERRVLREHERDVVRSLYHRLRSVSVPETESWEWLTPLILRAGDMCRTVAERLATSTIEHKRFDEALALAQEMIADDPCDETARAIAIRAHLGLGNRSDAMREFRRYRDVLRRELEAEPSPEIARLLQDPEHAAALAG